MSKFTIFRIFESEDHENLFILLQSQFRQSGTFAPMLTSHQKSQKKIKNAKVFIFMNYLAFCSNYRNVARLPWNRRRILGAKKRSLNKYISDGHFRPYGLEIQS